MAWVIVILLLGVLAALVWASADIGSGVYLKALCRAESADRVVALTFDDGPDADSTPRVLDLLKRYDVRATFFVVGEQARQNPEPRICSLMIYASFLLSTVMELLLSDCEP